jgi:hypothetical protein
MAFAHPPPMDINFDNEFLELPLAPNSRHICRFWFTARWSAFLGDLELV